MNTIDFTLSEEEWRRFKEWKATIPRGDDGSIGGRFTFCFSPTPLGCVVVVKSSCGAEVDLTKYEDW